jgi:hypothetical protein
VYEAVTSWQKYVRGGPKVAEICVRYARSGYSVTRVILRMLRYAQGDWGEPEVVLW